jgi:hypothetical protein
MSKQGTLPSEQPGPREAAAAGSTYVPPRLSGKKSLEVVTLATPQTTGLGGMDFPGHGYIGKQ